MQNVAVRSNRRHDFGVACRKNEPVSHGDTLAMPTKTRKYHSSSDVARNTSTNAYSVPRESKMSLTSTKMSIPSLTLSKLQTTLQQQNQWEKPALASLPVTEMELNAWDQAIDALNDMRHQLDALTNANHTRLRKMKHMSTDCRVDPITTPTRVTSSPSSCASRSTRSSVSYTHLTLPTNREV